MGAGADDLVEKSLIPLFCKNVWPVIYRKFCTIWLFLIKSMLLRNSGTKSTWETGGQISNTHVQKFVNKCEMEMNTNLF